MGYAGANRRVVSLLILPMTTTAMNSHRRRWKRNRIANYDVTHGDLRHAWSDANGWHFQTLDGSGGSTPGQISANVGYNPIALQYDTTLQVFYYDATNGDLRHTWSQ
jgi:hypothetical protein